MKNQGSNLSIATCTLSQMILFADLREAITTEARCPMREFPAQ